VQLHTSDTRILDARTLDTAFPALIPWLRPGLRVLDVGCGTGAITEGMATLVGPSGTVVGVDRDAQHIARASSRATSRPWMRFEVGDVRTLDLVEPFDVVAVARTLQWVAEDELALALSRLAMALVPGGRLIALDYNHAEHRWMPSPPPELPWFVERFCAWRQANDWHSDVLSAVPALCDAARLTRPRVDAADDVVRRGGAGFTAMSRIWPRVIETLGPKMAAERFLDEAERQRALDVISRWCDDDLMEQTMAARVLTTTRQTE
jgi:SAM-dependent methyltransferase